jgi:hypothetical protein
MSRLFSALLLVLGVSLALPSVALTPQREKELTELAAWINDPKWQDVYHQPGPFFWSAGPGSAPVAYDKAFYSPNLYIADTSRPLPISFWGAGGAGNAGWAGTRYEMGVSIATLDINGKIVDDWSLLLTTRECLNACPVNNMELMSWYNMDGNPLLSAGASGLDVLYNFSEGAHEVVFRFENYTLYPGKLALSTSDNAYATFKNVGWGAEHEWAILRLNDMSGGWPGLQANNSVPLQLKNVSIIPTTQTPAIPEPETYAMMLAGLGLMGAITRRRRNVR